MVGLFRMCTSLLVSALNAMVCCLMSPVLTEELIQDVGRHIKIFLSCFERFDKEMRKESDKPHWISSNNFICLLNLPDMLRLFGPLRNLWEGGGQEKRCWELFNQSGMATGKSGRSIC